MTNKRLTPDDLAYIILRFTVGEFSPFLEDKEWRMPLEETVLTSIFCELFAFYHYLVMREVSQKFRIHGDDLNALGGDVLQACESLASEKLKPLVRKCIEDQEWHITVSKYMAANKSVIGFGPENTSLLENTAFLSNMLNSEECKDNENKQDWYRFSFIYPFIRILCRIRERRELETEDEHAKQLATMPEGMFYGIGHTASFTSYIEVLSDILKDAQIPTHGS